MATIVPAEIFATSVCSTMKQNLHHWVLAWLLSLAGLCGAFLCSADEEDDFWTGKHWFETNAIIRALKIHNGNFYVGGAFTSVAGISATNVARWDGTNWFALGGGIPGTVETLEVTDEAVFAGGAFTEAGGVPAKNIARWDGASWSAYSDSQKRFPNRAV